MTCPCENPDELPVCGFQRQGPAGPLPCVIPVGPHQVHMYCHRDAHEIATWYEEVFPWEGVQPHPDGVFNRPGEWFPECIARPNG